MIIAIDGPAGSGKSSSARAVARRLDFRHLDSGAFYRALTHAALSAGLPAATWHTLDADALAALRVRAAPSDRGYTFFAGDEAIDDALRSVAVNAHVSLMAKAPGVRAWLLDTLRAAAHGVDLVADGRDIGTVVFPDADLKIFLVAEPRTRAERRLKEQGHAAPTSAEIDAEVARLEARDRIDSERAIAPLKKAADAVELDTSRLAFEEQVERIVALAESRMEAT
jgi:CMP/dCMP kinase